MIHRYGSFQIKRRHTYFVSSPFEHVPHFSIRNPFLFDWFESTKDQALVLVVDGNDKYWKCFYLLFHLQLMPRELDHPWKILTEKEEEGNN